MEAALNKKCLNCHGTGTDPVSRKTCKECDGSGWMLISHESGPMPSRDEDTEVSWRGN
jgi:DnaJ-class molecular chaperone